LPPAPIAATMQEVVWAACSVQGSRALRENRVIEHGTCLCLGAMLPSAEACLGLRPALAGDRRHAWDRPSAVDGRAVRGPDPASGEARVAAGGLGMVYAAVLGGTGGASGLGGPVLAGATARLAVRGQRPRVAGGAGGVAPEHRTRRAAGVPAVVQAHRRRVKPGSTLPPPRPTEKEVRKVACPLSAPRHEDSAESAQGHQGPAVTTRPVQARGCQGRRQR